ncbi:MAG: SDR family NAD(P)-dependent oxidoreductase [bacterium]|nr:SDR family NAD(P)-dependent oxidoreductase [bacterium]
MEQVQMIITGATGSIGSEAVRAMAKRGYAVIMACRNVEKGEAVKRRLLEENPSARLQVMQVDMASLKSVNRFVESLKDQGVALSGLFNNAGVMNRSFALTEDGFEQTVAVNYLAPYLLTRRLMPLFLPDAHVVNMVSLTCHLAHVDRDFFDKKEDDFRQLGTYGDSKLALLLFTIALSQRADFHVNMADPGVVNSKMLHMSRWYDGLADRVFRPFCKSPEKGALPAVNALTTEERLRFFNGNRCRKVPRKYMDNPQIEWLWATTEALLQRQGFDL